MANTRFPSHRYDTSAMDFTMSTDPPDDPHNLNFDFATDKIFRGTLPVPITLSLLKETLQNATKACFPSGRMHGNGYQPLPVPVSLESGLLHLSVRVCGLEPELHGLPKSVVQVMTVWVEAHMEDAYGRGISGLEFWIEIPPKPPRNAPTTASNARGAGEKRKVGRPLGSINHNSTKLTTITAIHSADQAWKGPPTSAAIMQNRIGLPEIREHKRKELINNPEWPTLPKNLSFLSALLAPDGEGLAQFIDDEEKRRLVQLFDDEEIAQLIESRTTATANDDIAPLIELHMTLYAGIWELIQGQSVGHCFKLHGPHLSAAQIAALNGGFDGPPDTFDFPPGPPGRGNRNAGPGRGRKSAGRATTMPPPPRPTSIITTSATLPTPNVNAIGNANATHDLLRDLLAPGPLEADLTALHWMYADPKKTWWHTPDESEAEVLLREARGGLSGAGGGVEAFGVELPGLHQVRGGWSGWVDGDAALDEDTGEEEGRGIGEGRQESEMEEGERPGVQAEMDGARDDSASDDGTVDDTATVDGMVDGGDAEERRLEPPPPPQKKKVQRRKFKHWVPKHWAP